MCSIGFLFPLFLSFCRSNLLGNRRLRGMRWEAPSFPLNKTKDHPSSTRAQRGKERGGVGGGGRRGFAQHNLSKWERRRRSGEEEEICLRRKDERERKECEGAFCAGFALHPFICTPSPQKMGCTLQRARVGAGVSPKKGVVFGVRRVSERVGGWVELS